MGRKNSREDLTAPLTPNTTNASEIKSELGGVDDFNPVRLVAVRAPCCPNYRILQAINGLVIVLGLFMIAWYGVDLERETHQDRLESGLIGLGGGIVHLLLGIGGFFYAYKLKKEYESKESFVQMDHSIFQNRHNNPQDIKVVSDSADSHADPSNDSNSQNITSATYIPDF